MRNTIGVPGKTLSTLLIPEKAIMFIRNIFSSNDLPEDLQQACTKLSIIAKHQKDIKKTLDKFKKDSQSLARSWELLNHAVGDSLLESSSNINSCKKDDIDVFSRLQNMLTHQQSRLTNEIVDLFTSSGNVLSKECNRLEQLKNETKKLYDNKVNLIRKLESSSGLLSSDSRGKRLDGIRRELDSVSDQYSVKSKEFILAVKNLDSTKSIKLFMDVRDYLRLEHDSYLESFKAFESEKDTKLQLFYNKTDDIISSTTKQMEEEKSELENGFRAMGKSRDMLDREFSSISESFVFPGPEHTPSFLEGEYSEMDCENIVCTQGSWCYFGRLLLTNARICFMEFGRKSNDGSVSKARLLFDVPLGCIDRVDSAESGDEHVVNFGTKDLSSYSLGFYHSSSSAAKLRLSLIDTCVLYNETQRFAFQHGQSRDASLTRRNVNILQDYSRMGLLSEYDDESPFRLSDVNKDFTTCPTYPSSIVVPREVSDADIVSCADFRSKGRFIAVVWKNPEGHQVICRCAQPLVGLTRNHNPQDEEYVSKVVSYTRNMSILPSERHPVLLCDSRPHANAVGNMAVGGGWEMMEFYSGCEFLFQNIANIHVVRESFHGLHNMFSIKLASESSKSIDYSAISDRYSSIISSLRQGKGLATWFNHLSSVIGGARQIVTHICQHQGSVIVHCSDGWDRTSQMTSLAQLILDPYYRTLDGFIVLIEREWISFGHKFAQRFGHGSGRDLLDTQRSPIFIQWLDCVWQHVYRFPNEFEFKPSLLVRIIDSIYSCRYGNFLCDSEKERVELDVRSKTQSLWDSFDESILNPSYSPQDSLKVLLLESFSPSELDLWLSFFIRWDRSLLRRRDLNLTQLHESLSLQ